MYKEITAFIKDLYPSKEYVPLHAPCFIGQEKEYLSKCIDSTFVSSVGEYVSLFEKMVCDYTGSKFAVATTNGTAALHIALLLSGVKNDDEVLTQALTFVATANAITYLGAKPVFIDSDKNNLGMSPASLANFLESNAVIKNGHCYNKKTNKRISACVPMHTFGHPVEIDKIIEICSKYNIEVVEDAAESLGSFYKNKHTGLFSKIGILSFNGNKVITCGGGGMLLIQDEELAIKAKHITTTAKRPHAWEFFHDQVGYNYRLPNINAALACAQMENIKRFVEDKRNTAKLYREFFKSKTKLKFLDEPSFSKSNYWLNAIFFQNIKERDEFLTYTNKNNVMTRPIWILMNKLPAFKDCQSTDLTNAQYYEDRIVNIPSSVRL